jgi:hypothetical protein
MSFKDVIDSYRKDTEENRELGKEATIKVSAATSILAFLYEKARIAVEFKEEHLLRKLAIERILNRRIKLGTSRANLALYLLKELIRARYLPNDSVPERKAEEIDKILSKYYFLMDNYPTVFRIAKWDVLEWLISCVSCEIENSLSPATSRDSLAKLMANLLHEETGLSDSDLFVACQKSLNKADRPILRQILFIEKYPFWEGGVSTEHLKEVANNLEQTIKDIEEKIQQIERGRVYKMAKSQIAPFVILRDILDRDPGFTATFQDEKLVEQKVRNMCSLKYSQTADRLKRMVFRSVVYIFLTKMVIGLIVELPLDRLTLGHVNWKAAGINLIFPPILMYLVGSRTRVPGQKNTESIVKRIKNILFENSLGLSENEKRLGVSSKFGILQAFFRIIYFLTFILSFGLVTYFLIKIGFTIASIGVFLFFLSVVSFFAYLVRESTKDIVLIRDDDSFFGSVFDLFFLPILRVGQRLSEEVARLNLFVFFFDFIIEAPLKTLIEITEEWFAFVREKKEEVA